MVRACRAAGQARGRSKARRARASVGRTGVDRVCSWLRAYRNGWQGSPRSPCSLPGVAAAQSARDLAAAKQAFKEGEEAEARGDYQTALARFGQALSVKDTAQLHLRVGAAQERLGRLTDALASYQRGLDKAAGLPAVAKIAREQLDGLRPRIPTLTLIAVKPIPGLVITLDGAPVAPSAVGTALKVDPGTRRLQLSAPGYQPRDQAISVPERLDTRVELSLVPEAPAIVPVAPAPSRLPGAFTLGAGGAVLIAGVALLIVSYTTDATVDALCHGADRMRCPASRKDEILADVSRANALRFSSLGVMAVGAAGVAVGSTLLVKAARRPTPTTGYVRVVPSLGAGLMGVTAVGVF